MPILSAKNRNALLRQTHGAKPKPNEKKQSKPSGGSERAPTAAEKEKADIAALSAGFHQAEADKAENSYVHQQLFVLEANANLECSTRLYQGTVQVKGGKLAKAGKAKLLSRPSALPRSQPGSPALTGIGSPSLAPTSSPAQDKAKKHRLLLIHELAVRDQTFGELLHRWEGGEAEFHTHLEKVAHFDPPSQRWTLKQPCWKELDVYAYSYEKDADRKKAIDNAIKRYDRLRLGVTDPLWQRLLPVSERGKGICLSKVQAAIANKTPSAPAPKISIAEASSPSIDSDSGSTSSKQAIGGEPMARSNSGNKTKKMTAAQAQAKRLLSSKPAAVKPTKAAAAKATSMPSSARSSPKVSPTKPTTAKVPTGKGGRVLSKEFISDSESDSSEETPLSQTATTNKTVQQVKQMKESIRAKPQAIERATEKTKPVEKTRDIPATKPRPAQAKQPKVMDSIRVEGSKPRAEVTKQIMRAPKRYREDDEDSSSSATPLSKRHKVQDHPSTKPKPKLDAPKRRLSDASNNSRASSSSQDNIVTKPKPKLSEPRHRESDASNNSRGSSSTQDSIVTKPKPKLSEPKHRESDASTNSRVSSKDSTVTKPKMSQPKYRESDSSTNSRVSSSSKDLTVTKSKLSEPKQRESDTSNNSRGSSSGQDNIVTKPKPKTNAPKDRESDASKNSRVSSSSQASTITKPKPGEAKHREPDSRVSSSGNSTANKVKTSPVKSSPLASSPPTNASDIDAGEVRDNIMASSKKRKFETGRDDKRDSDRYEKTKSDRYEKSQSDRYEKSDSSDSSASKRPKYGHQLSAELLHKAREFKAFYASYEALHRDLSALEAPPEDEVQTLNDMHQRLSRMKQAIQDGVGQEC